MVKNSKKTVIAMTKMELSVRKMTKIRSLMWDLCKRLERKEVFRSYKSESQYPFGTRLT